jgi:mono/diheme cytochrome c family protein
LSTEALSPRALLGLALAAALLAAGGCRQNMHNQHKVEPLEKSEFYADAQASRPFPAGTVARGGPGVDIAPYTGLTVSSQPIPATGPARATPAMLRRGQEQFNVFCSPCHGRLGNGRGMIVRRGYKQPTSFHDPRLRGSGVDYFYSVITEGFGVMPSYAPQVPVEDRWAIAAYIRALQYSQNARLAELPPERRAAVEAELRGLTTGAPPASTEGDSVTRPDAADQYDRRPDPNKVP